MTDLHTVAAGIEDQFKLEVTTEEAVTKNVIIKHYKHQIALMQKDAEGKRNLEKIRADAFNNIIILLQAHIKILTDQLEKVRTNAREVTAKALQSAFHLQVAKALQRVVDVKEPVIKDK